MSIVKRIAAWVAAEPRQQSAALQLRAASAGGMIPAWQQNRPVWLPSTIETNDTHAYRKVPLIFRCVQYLSHATGTAPLRVYEPNSDEADDTHPLRQLLVRPNPGMGEGRFLSFLAMNMAVTNFVVIEKERDRVGNVIGLWPLRSDWIRPILRNQAAPDWEYRVPGREPVILAAEDTIPIPYADTPDQSPTGIGPLVAAFREAQITGSITDFVKAFMDRGALPLYALVPQDEGTAAKQWEKEATRNAFLEAWRQRYMGLSNATEPMPLLGVKDVKRVGLDFNELAYADLNNRIDAGICQAFGIPPILVSAPLGLERSTFSNTEEARRSFYEDTMSYLWSRIDDAFTRHLLPDFEDRPGWDIHFDTGEIAALQDDRNEATTRAVAAFSAGMISRHVAQKEGGYEIHGPDEIMLPFNVIPLPVAKQNGQRARVTVTEVPGKLVHSNGHLHALPTHDPTAPRFVYREGRRYVNEARLSPVEREQRAAIQTTNQNSITALANVIQPRLQSFFAEQAERITEQLGLRAMATNGAMDTAQHAKLDLLGFGRGRHSKRAVEAVDWAGEDDLLRRIFAAWWESVTDMALGNAEALLGTEISWTVVNPYIADVTGVLGQRIVGINAQTRTDIEDTLTRLMSEGTTVPEMGDAIRDLFAQTYQNRHLTVARTESMVGYAEASTLAYEASGVVDRVQVLDNASHTESYKGAADGLTCAKRNGLVVPLRQGTYHVRSDHPNGSASLAPVLTTPLGEV